MSTNSAIKKQKKQKSKNTKNLQSSNTNKTVSGLQGSSLITNLISALVGLFIFVIGPYVVNILGNTTLGALFNIFPTGIVMALFIKEEEFKSYFTKLLYTPFFFIIVNWVTYYLYAYCGWSPLSTIYLNFGLWVIACIIGYFM
jgi:hypothetical protein